MKRVALAAAVIAALIAGCATSKTEVSEYRAAPGQDVLTGKGGAVKVVDGLDVWQDGGTPPRQYRVVAQSKSNYRTGTAGDLGQRSSAIKQMVDEAKKQGADAVIILDEQSEVAGVASQPGMSTTKVTGYGNYAKATTTNTVGYAGTVKAHSVGALFVKYVN